MSLAPVFSPQFDGFIAAALMVFALGCLLSMLPSVLAGILCARTMHYLNSFLALALGVGMAIAAYALCFALTTLFILSGIAYNIDGEALILANVIVSAVVGAAGALATWRICLAWNGRRQNRLS